MKELPDRTTTDDTYPGRGRKRWRMFWMLRTLVCSLLLLSVSIPVSGTTLKPGDTEMAAILRAIDYVFADSFARAHAITDALNDTFPGQPIYHLLRASVVHSQMMDGEDLSREREFMTDIDYCVAALERWIEKNPGDAWGHFLMGSALGYKSIWQGQKKSWLKSLLTALKAKGKFEDALRLDSMLYDCYTGIGAYHYWSSVKLKKVFPFLSDNRKEGLAELKLAMDSSYISSRAAAVGYGWALLNEKKYADALLIAHQLSESTGRGRNALWLLGGVSWGRGDLRRAAEYYWLLIESLERAGGQNYYNLIYCRYRRGFSLYGLQKYEEAQKEFQTILSYKPSKAVRDRHRKTFQKTNEYLEKIRTVLAGK